MIFREVKKREIISCDFFKKIQKLGDERVYGLFDSSGEYNDAKEWEEVTDWCHTASGRSDLWIYASPTTLSFLPIKDAYFAAMDLYSDILLLCFTECTNEQLRSSDHFSNQQRDSHLYVFSNNTSHLFTECYYSETKQFHLCTWNFKYSHSWQNNLMAGYAYRS